MATPSSTPQPNPERIFETLDAYQQTAALRAAIELDVFTAIGEGNTTVASLAQHCNASERGMRILCDYLTIRQFLTKDGHHYGLTPESALFLDRRSAAYVGSMANFMGSPQIADSFRNLAAVVRKGGTLMGEEGCVSDENPVWVEFARSMAPLVAAPADAIARILGAEAGQPWKVLDIAAGHGLFGIAIAKLNPKAQIMALDWKHVLAVARENAEKAGVSGRLSTIAGSAFDADFGGGFDLILLTNFLHHFSPNKNEVLLKKVHAALASGGRAAALEFVPNEDRISPPLAASFSMMMLGITAQGDAYTYSELEAMFLSAGFEHCELHALPPTPQSLMIACR